MYINNSIYSSSNTRASVPNHNDVLWQSHHNLRYDDDSFELIVGESS